MLDAKGQPLRPHIWRRIERSWTPEEVPKPYVPACFPNTRSFLAWLEMWTQREDQAAGFCVDCTAERKAAMMSQGRCEFTAVRFDKDPDGFPRGNR